MITIIWDVAIAVKSSAYLEKGSEEKSTYSRLFKETYKLNRLG